MLKKCIIWVLVFDLLGFLVFSISMVSMISESGQHHASSFTTIMFKIACWPYYLTGLDRALTIDLKTISVLVMGWSLLGLVVALLKNRLSRHSDQ